MKAKQLTLLDAELRRRGPCYTPQVFHVDQSGNVVFLCEGIKPACRGTSASRDRLVCAVAKGETESKSQRYYLELCSLPALDSLHFCLWTGGKLWGQPAYLLEVRPVFIQEPVTGVAVGRRGVVEQ